MPRRPSKKAGKKAGPRPVKRGDASVKRWDKLSDIPMDEEDQFHASRDRILLEGEEGADEDDGDDEEVFALKGMRDPSDDDDEDDDAVSDNDNEEEHGLGTPTTSKSKAKPKSKSKKAQILDDAEEEEEEEEEEEGWGRKKSAYYASNADNIESDDEEANEMEEQEARRLQSKARDALDDDDFGLVDVDDGRATEEDVLDEPEEHQATPLPTLPTDKQALLRHLETTNPEALALARDWEDVAWNICKTQQKLAKMEADPEQDKLGLGMVHLHHQALLTYGTTLAFYLHLRASSRYTANPNLLRNHPVMKRLLTLKQSLATLEDLDFALSDEDEDSDREDLSDPESELEDADGDSIEEGSEDEEQLVIPVMNGKKKKRLENNELDELLRDAEGLWDADLTPVLNGKKSKSRPNGLTNGDVHAEPPKKKRKTSTNSPSKPVFDLVEPTFTPTTSTTPVARADLEADAFGERHALTAADAQDKKARRRSLAFYTSKLDAAQAKREGARAAAAGGDDDIPYRVRDRKGKAAMEKGGRAQGADLDGEDVQQEIGKKRARVDDGGGEEAEQGEDGYYSLVKKKAKEQKEQKKAKYEAARAAERVDPDQEGQDGPRGISRAILKNKGLTPHRAKSVRNPRVKKRMRFDKAQKAIRSQKAVFKSGVDASRYDGERSGISKVVKSVRL